MFVVKIPLINGNGISDGCEKAGNSILEKIQEINCNEQGYPINKNLIDLEEIHVDNKNIENSNELIYKNSLEIIEEKPRTIFLGGDHSISYSIGRAFLDNCRKNQDKPCLIVFDSCPNCLSLNYVKEKFPNNKNWLRGLIEVGFPSQNILLVGVRNMNKEELIFLKENNIRIISMNQLLDDIGDTCDIIMEFSNGKNLYLSLDISVVDPSFAPATCSKEPGGLSSREFIYLIHRLNKVKNLRVIDLVEVNVEEDKKHEAITTKLGAKILAEFL